MIDEDDEEMVRRKIFAYILVNYVFANFSQNRHFPNDSDNHFKLTEFHGIANEFQQQLLTILQNNFQ